MKHIPLAVTEEVRVAVEVEVICGLDNLGWDDRTTVGIKYQPTPILVQKCAPHSDAVGVVFMIASETRAPHSWEVRRWQLVSVSGPLQKKMTTRGPDLKRGVCRSRFETMALDAETSLSTLY